MTSHKRCIAFLNNLRSLRPHCMSQRKRVARSINTIVHPCDSSGATFFLTLVYISSPSMSCCRNWHTPSDLVVDHWTSDVESSSHLDFLFLHAIWTPFGRLISCKITSIISMSCDFTTKSEGI